MREFVLFSRKGWTIGDFDPNDLKNYGRLDLVARCIISAFALSRNLRKDVVFHLLLYGPRDPPKYIKFRWNAFKGILFNESSVGLILKKALEGKKRCGVTIKKASFQDVIRSLSNKSIYLLHEKGIEIDKIKFDKNCVFVLGDQIGIPKKDENFVKRFAKFKVSLNNVSYLSSQVITIINYILDRNRL